MKDEYEIKDLGWGVSIWQKNVLPPPYIEIYKEDIPWLIEQLQASLTAPAVSYTVEVSAGKASNEQGKTNDELQ